MDLVSHAHKHNEANGEDNRDGHNENFSWNNGAEGATDDWTVLDRRRQDVTALLGTLFASRGSIMLTAGDEGGRSQRGNNNAYCQDNEITWVDWKTLDGTLIDHTAFLAGLRNRFTALRATGFFSGVDGDVEWLTQDGTPMTVGDWENAQGKTLSMVIRTPDAETGQSGRLAILINRDREPRTFRLPVTEGGWQVLSPGLATHIADIEAAPRSVTFCVES